MSVEQKLSEAFAVLAEQAPSTCRLPGAPETAPRRRAAPRRPWAMALAAAGGVLVIVLGAQQLRGLGPDRADPAAQPTAPGPSDPAPTAGPPTAAPPTPGGLDWTWRIAVDLPPGWQQADRRINSGSQDDIVISPDGALVCTITSYAAGADVVDPAGVDPGRGDIPVDIGGVTGFLTPYDGLPEGSIVVWRPDADSWATVLCQQAPGGQVDADSELLIARAVSFRDAVFPLPFRLGYMPDALAASMAASVESVAGKTGSIGGYVTFTAGEAAGDEADGAVAQTVAFGLRVGPPQLAGVAGGTPVTVRSAGADRQAYIYGAGNGGGTPTLEVAYDGFAITVNAQGFSTAEAVDAVVQDMIRMVESVTIAPDPADSLTWFDGRDVLP